MSDLYSPSPAGNYYYFRGVNPRAFIAWVCGWAPQLPGFIANVNQNVAVPRACTEMFYLAFPLGMSISFSIYFGLNRLFPPKGLGEYDDVDYYDTFASDEALKLGVSPIEKTESEEKEAQPSYSIDSKAADTKITSA